MAAVVRRDDLENEARRGEAIGMSALPLISEVAAARNALDYRTKCLVVAALAESKYG